jgi:ferredoxin-thioredoxin reductase catalytic subunit
MFVATLSTRNFSFEAYGRTHDDAWGALVQGLRRHGEQYKICACWFAQDIGNIEVREIAVGCAYRDREAI